MDQATFMTPRTTPSGDAGTANGNGSHGAAGRAAIDLGPADTFVRRHIGPSEDEVREMLEFLGLSSLDELTDATVPEAIRLRRPLQLGPPRGEHELLAELKSIASRNQVLRSVIGMGYYDTITPPVIQRNILENPGWYTQYTPYQAEIAQGRLEALLNFQTMVSDLTALPLANASLLDEATAAAEAMAMCRSIAGGEGSKDLAFFVAQDCHPQTIAVVRTRARSMGIPCVVGDPTSADFTHQTLCGVLLQYPTTDGRIVDYSDVVARAHQAGALVVMAADLLALTLITPPGELGADIAVGSTQRFGVPMGFGGPHAAYMSTKAEHARKMPGRLVGVSKDAQGNPALRLAIQTREQHIRREKATSNICTAQVLLAVMAGMYAVYHGPHGLRRIAERVHALTLALAAGLERLGHSVGGEPFFDTLRLTPNGLPAESVIASARSRGYNLRDYGDGSVGISLDEAATRNDVETLIECFAGGATFRLNVDELAEAGLAARPAIANRTSSYLAHPVFNTHHSETELLRYITKLQSRDLSLTHSMIPLGSCTMKLNATSEMLPVTWPEFSRIHPFAPADQTEGYRQLFTDLEAWLAEITGFAAVSLQPNAGSQGEYAGLLAIRGYHESRGEAHRDVCLIPVSAHGTNPSSAIIAGMKVIAVACNERGDVDIADLRAKAEQHKDRLAALMVTYPSTHGVFEEGIVEVCRIVHEAGGQVYMDGANMNAQVGLCRPGDIGADVCHLNLHKTFCIPHGGGGPGMGPIAVAKHLAPFLPGDPRGGTKARGHEGTKGEVGPVSAASHGSASILPISWVYIALMGGEGLKRATQVAILNANYMAKRLGPYYPILFKGKGGRVAHEFVMDARRFDADAGVKVDDIAKRLMDYGFHAPTMSWPVPGTLMVEPTESESKPELDRFCDAMIAIREEIRAVEQGKADRADNVLKHAPHTAMALLSDTWTHPYTRSDAAYPAAWLKGHKFWPAVGRIDNPYGDRNLVCTCPPVDAYGAP
jgi:glycine dehydrogenase